MFERELDATLDAMRQRLLLGFRRSLFDRQESVDGDESDEVCPRPSSACNLPMVFQCSVEKHWSDSRDGGITWDPFAELHAPAGIETRSSRGVALAPLPLPLALAPPTLVLPYPHMDTESEGTGDLPDDGEPLEENPRVDHDARHASSALPASSSSSFLKFFGRGSRSASSSGGGGGGGGAGGAGGGVYTSSSPTSSSAVAAGAAAAAAQAAGGSPHSLAGGPRPTVSVAAAAADGAYTAHSYGGSSGCGSARGYNDLASTQSKILDFLKERDAAKETANRVGGPLANFSAQDLVLESENGKSTIPNHFESESLHPLDKKKAIDSVMRVVKVSHTNRRSMQMWNQTRVVEEVTLEGVMGAITVLNVLCLGISSDVGRDWLGWLFVDICFALAFTVEAALKVFRLGLRRFATGPDYHWHIFEGVVVLLAYTEIGLQWLSPSSIRQGNMLTIVRVLRVVRVVRILRLLKLKLFKELLMMINGALGGLKTLLWAMLLIAVPIYIVALVLRDSLDQYAGKGSGAEYFSSVPLAFFTIFRCIVAGSCDTQDGKPIFVLVSQTYGWMYALIYCFTVVLMTFGLFNVIVAIFIENTLDAAKWNDAKQKRQRLMDQAMFTERVIELVQFIWRAQTGCEESDMTVEDYMMVSQMELTPEFFEDLRNYKEFQDILRNLDIADEDQLDLFDTLDVDGGGTIDVDELVRGIAKLRGDARRSDVVSVNLMMRSVQLAMAEVRAELHQVLSGAFGRGDLDVDVDVAANFPLEDSQPALPDQVLQAASPTGGGGGVEAGARRRRSSSRCSGAGAGDLPRLRASMAARDRRVSVATALQAQGMLKGPASLVHPDESKR